MQFRIRKAIKQDIYAIIDLCIEHAAYEKEVYDPKNKAEKLLTMLFGYNPQLQCLVVEVDNDIVGYASFSRECSTWNADYYVHLDCLYLKEENRGFGIGEAMINEIVAYAKQIKAHHMEWQTPIFNHRAIKFYERIGSTAKEKKRFILNL